jgi:branched-chain amino acid aminotransferase
MSDEKKGCAYINGKYYSTDDAKISIYDRGFSGVSVFDATSLVDGYVFRVGPHVSRFFKSIKAARLEPALSEDELKEVIFETVRRSGIKDCAVIFMIATPGVPVIPAFEQSGPQPSMIVSVTPYRMPPSHLPEDTFTKGIKVHISSIRNFPPQCLDQRIKSFNRLHHYLAISEALDAGAHDVIMMDTNGNISEGIYCNVWAAKEGCLYTPAGHMLRGITRQTVFEMAENLGIKASETQMSPYDLYNADEVFFSTTAGGVLPIVEVDRRIVKDGKVGPIATDLLRLYQQWHHDPKFATLVVK